MYVRVDVLRIVDDAHDGEPGVAVRLGAKIEVLGQARRSRHTARRSSAGSRDGAASSRLSAIATAAAVQTRIRGLAHRRGHPAPAAAGGSPPAGAAPAEVHLLEVRRARRCARTGGGAPLEALQAHVHAPNRRARRNSHSATEYPCQDGCAPAGGRPPKCSSRVCSPVSYSNFSVASSSQLIRARPGSPHQRRAHRSPCTADRPLHRRPDPMPSPPFERRPSSAGRRSPFPCAASSSGCATLR